MPKNKGEKLRRLFRSNKVLLPFSLFLAIWVWLILIVGSSETEERTITGIPVRVDFSETISESLGLQAFWAQSIDPAKLTVDIVVRGKKYDVSPAVVTAEDFSVVLLPKDLNGNDINAVGDYQLRVDVSRKPGIGQQSYEIVTKTPASFQVYFDHLKELEFNLEAAPIGVGITAPEGYYAGVPLLSQKTVKVSGPARDVNSVKQIKAQFMVEKELQATQTFNDVEIIPGMDFGAVSQYLQVDTGERAVSVTIPVWKKAVVSTDVEFKDRPSAYAENRLPVTISPAQINAALPEQSVPAPGARYIVGQISFKQLSPTNRSFRLAASELKEIHFFDAVTEFRAEVDMTGMAEVRLTLPAANIAVSGGSAAFRDVPNVVVVGPADAVEALTGADLRGNVEITADTPKGSGTLPVQITIPERDDCWIYAPKDYPAACVVH
ncbi:MAG: hypothetical protein LBC83_02645 [Oscillospiraceae bacterium]|nr:hypothetical protein [Oscillospiraceae bacterium]